MLILLGMFLVIISLLLFTYYRRKANEDDYNRPSYFNSKFRKYLMFVCIVIIFAAAAYLFVIEGFYNFIWMIPVFCYGVYEYYQRKNDQSILIKKVFHNYHVFCDPQVGYGKDTQLMAPIEFLLLQAGLPDEYCKKAHKYLEERIKSGELSHVSELPQEAWTVFHCVGEKKIAENPEDRIPDFKIRDYYEEAFEGKPRRNLSTVVSGALWWLEARVERIFTNFSFVSVPRPDFTNQEVQLEDVVLRPIGNKDDRKISLFALFPQYPGDMAKKFGWVEDLDEYCVLAALEFQRRYPKHCFSRMIKKQHKYSDQKIFDYAQNWEKLDTGKIKLFA